MKKLLIVVFCLTALCSFGQEKQKVKLTSTAGIDILMFPVSKILKETHRGGFGLTLQFEIKKNEKFGYTIMSGYNYILAKPDYKSFVQFPALFGFKYHFDEILSIGQSVGVSYFTEDMGYKFTYSPTVVFQFDKLSTEVKYMTSLNPGHANDISTVSFKVAYNL